MAARPRLWRAKAYGTDPDRWTRRQPVARAAACTEGALDAFRARHEALGRTVDVWRVTTIDDQDPPAP